MLTLLKQARSALFLLNPEEVRSRAGRLVTIGLVASSDRAYARLEDFLAEGGGSREFVFRAGTVGAPELDLVPQSGGAVRKLDFPESVHARDHGAGIHGLPAAL